MLQCGWYVHVEWVELLLNFCFDSAAVRPALASALTSLAAFLLFFSSIYTQTLAPSKLGFPSLSLSVVTLVVSRAAFVRGTKQTNKQTNKQSLARDRGSRVPSIVPYSFVCLFVRGTRTGVCTHGLLDLDM